MELLNDAELLFNIKERFKKGEIFTRIGPSLLVVNPFKLNPGIFKINVQEQYIENN